MSASDLLYNRRSRIGRQTPEPELGLRFGSAIVRNPSHRHNLRYGCNHNHRYDVDRCDLSRRSPHVRHLSNRESVQLNRATGQSGTCNNGISRETSSNRINRPRFTRNDELPRAVLLARERLHVRLRGVSLSGNRQSSSASSGISRDEFASSDEFRLVEAGDRDTETPREWLMGDVSFTHSTTQTEPVPSLQDSKKKPPGLNQRAINSLLQRVFSHERKEEEEFFKFEGEECSICLERFKEGEKVICLSCGHGFHYECLNPWVRNCGDCPYCRTGIVVDHQ